MDTIPAPLRLTHVVDILRIQSLAYTPEFVESEAALTWKLRDGLHYSFGVFEDGVLVAYAIAFPWTSGRPVVLNEVDESPPDANALYCHDVAIDPAFAGRQLGKILMEATIERAWDPGWTRMEIVGVQGGERYWAQMGFAIDGPAGDDYGPDAVKMSLDRAF